MTMIPVLPINPERFTNIDFTNITNGNQMETLVILITVWIKIFKQQTYFTALIIEQNFNHILHLSRHTKCSYWEKIASQKPGSQCLDFAAMSITSSDVNHQYFLLYRSSAYTIGKNLWYLWPANGSKIYQQ